MQFMRTVTAEKLNLAIICVDRRYKMVVPVMFGICMLNSLYVLVLYSSGSVVRAPDW